LEFIYDSLSHIFFVHVSYDARFKKVIERYTTRIPIWLPWLTLQGKDTLHVYQVNMSCTLSTSKVKMKNQLLLL